MRVGRVLSGLVMIVAGCVTGATNGHAILAEGNPFASAAFFWECVKVAGGSDDACAEAALIVDPPAVGVTGITLSFQRNSSFFVFDPAKSGPLGAFSVGGDAPPAVPGVGTQPFQALPTTGYTPGAPLPGSTLTYTDVGGLLTLNYQLAGPVTVSDDVNFFRLNFTLAHPVLISFAKSTVTYLSSGPGADFTQTNFVCTTSSGGSCGSTAPSSGITVNFAFVPEPAGWLVLLVGAGALLVRFRPVGPDRAAARRSAPPAR